MGEMDFAGSMVVHFGSIPPGEEYDFPILGFTFVYASKFLIGVLDLHPLTRDKEYMDKYIEPLKDIPPRYEGIPFAEGDGTGPFRPPVPPARPRPGSASSAG